MSKWGKLCSLTTLRTLYLLCLILKNVYMALAGVVKWVECGPVNQGLPVQFPVRAHAWVVGQVPGWGGAQEETTL